uniref:Uncharacterized protein n=1 Tax=Periophthalmus magnuspinnatus TaxID=409849 RepID=A0A3B4AMT5_9GOBI
WRMFRSMILTLYFHGNTRVPPPESYILELEQLSRLDPDSSDLDPRDSFPLSREVEAHRTSLDQLRQQVQKSEAAARALDSTLRYVVSYIFQKQCLFCIVIKMLGYSSA